MAVHPGMRWLLRAGRIAGDPGPGERYVTAAGSSIRLPQGGRFRGIAADSRGERDGPRNGRNRRRRAEGRGVAHDGIPRLLGKAPSGRCDQGPGSRCGAGPALQPGLRGTRARNGPEHDDRPRPAHVRRPGRAQSHLADGARGALQRRFFSRIRVSDRVRGGRTPGDTRKRGACGLPSTGSSCSIPWDGPLSSRSYARAPPW